MREPRNQPACPRTRTPAPSCSTPRMAVIRGKGFAATSVDELCQAAGVTKGAFFHHFRSKEELGVAAAAHFGEMAAGDLRHRALPVARRPAASASSATSTSAARSSQGELPEYTCLLGTMVQEAYATHPAIREACEREIIGHATTLEADIAAALAARGQGGGLDAAQPGAPHPGACCRAPSSSPRPPAVRRLPPTALAICAATSHCFSRPTAKGRLAHELRRRIRRRGSRPRTARPTASTPRRRSPSSRSTARCAASSAGATTCPTARSRPSRWR